MGHLQKSIRGALFVRPPEEKKRSLCCVVVTSSHTNMLTYMHFILDHRERDDQTNQVL